MSDAVAVVRRFNRSYTQRIGVFEDSFLGLGMPLGPARLLFEIGAAAQVETGAAAQDPLTTQTLRERLGLDSGYLSRLLRRLEKDGLIRVTPDPGDRRRRQVSLTEAGRERWKELERRSDDQARLIVDPLTERQRERLARARAGWRAPPPPRPRPGTWSAGTSRRSAAASASTRRARRRRTRCCSHRRRASSSWRSPTASRWPAAACRRSLPWLTGAASASSSACGSTTTGAARASGQGCCVTWRTGPARSGTAPPGSTRTRR